MPLSRLVSWTRRPRHRVNRPNPSPLRLEPLEDRALMSGVYAVGPSPINYGQMGLSSVIRYDSTTAAVLPPSFVPYGDANFRGEIRIAVGDVTGDATLDTVTIAGPFGSPHVRVFDGGAGNALVAEWNAYAPNLAAGSYVAIGNVDGVGKAEVITAYGSTSSVSSIKVWDASGGTPATPVYPTTPLFEFFSGFVGNRIAAGDFNQDGKAEIVAGTVGGTPAVKVYDVSTPATPVVIKQYAAPFVQGGQGTNIAVGDINGDGFKDLVISSAISQSNGGSRVKVFAGMAGGLTDTVLKDFVPYSGYSSRITLATTDADGDGKADIITGAVHNSDVRIYSGAGVALVPPAIRQQFPYGLGAGRGVWVGGDGNL